MRFSLALGLWCLLVIGCGGASGTDAGLDAGRRDAGRADAGGEGDAGEDGGTDAGSAGGDAGSDAGSGADAGADAGSEGDAGADAGASDGGPPSSCDPRLGAPCSDSPECGSGFECAVGRCRPQGRQLCGGFAGAACTMPPYTECLYYSSADFGPCFTPEERACLCARYPSAFQCF